MAEVIRGQSVSFVTWRDEIAFELLKMNLKQDMMFCQIDEPKMVHDVYRFADLMVKESSRYKEIEKAESRKRDEERMLARAHEAELRAAVDKQGSHGWTEPLKRFMRRLMTALGPRL